MEAFTFGYWGWGNHTTELVKTVDRIERKRGYRSPIWVDTRIHRNVLARGFRGDAFASTAGKSNYRWCQGLGNQAIIDGGRMRLMRPKAVQELLSLIEEADTESRRTIAFCACECPEKHGKPCCHRALVSRRLIAEASKQKVPLTVSEWPGGEPQELPRLLTVSPAAFRKIQAAKGEGRIPVPEGMTVSEAAAIPWYSILHLTMPEKHDLKVYAGPARATAYGWRIQLYGTARDPAIPHPDRSSKGYAARDSTCVSRRRRL